MDLVGFARRNLPREQLAEGQTTTDLGGHRRTRRGSEQDIRIEQCLSRFRNLVRNSQQDSGLPGDTCQSPTRENQCAVVIGHQRNSWWESCSRPCRANPRHSAANAGIATPAAADFGWTVHRQVTAVPVPTGANSHWPSMWSTNG